MRKINRSTLTSFGFVFAIVTVLFLFNKLITYVAPKPQYVLEEDDYEEEDSFFGRRNNSVKMLANNEVGDYVKSKETETIETTDYFEKGDTFLEILKRNNIPEHQAHQANLLLSKKFNFKKFKEGQEVSLVYVSHPDHTNLSKVSIQADMNTILNIVETSPGQYDLRVEKVKYNKSTQIKIAEISGNLYTTAKKNEIPHEIVQSLDQKFSQIINFKRDLKEGAVLKVLYDEMRDDFGKNVKVSPFTYASIETNGKTFELIKYDFQNGKFDYFDKNGNSYKKSVLSAPLKNARLSSGYGWRMHPVHHRRIMHKGDDWAARHGTPIMAAADGVVKEVTRKNGYGRVVTIKHSGPYATLYGHMSKFANIKPGDHISRGQIIGYVGQDGTATGPHLHFEVHVNGVAVNPRGTNLPNGNKLEKKDLQIFQAQINGLYKNYADLGPGKGKPATSTAQKKSNEKQEQVAETPKL